MTNKTLNKYINDAAKLDEQIKELTKTLAAMKEKIIDGMNESGDTDKTTSRYKAHLSTQERKNIDTGKIKKESPETWETLFNEYPKITQYNTLKFTAV